MKNRKGSVNRILKLCMTGIGIVLFILLFGKAIGLLRWQDMGISLMQEAKTHASSWAVFIWKQSYPAISGDIDQSKVEEEQGKPVPWYLEWVWNRIPIYRYHTAAERENVRYTDGDPSYSGYLAKQEFLKEHEYLFQYGAEDTNQQSAEEPVAEPEQAVVLAETTTPAYTVRADRTVIGKQYVREQLADYDFLMKHFFSVHPSTTAGRDQMDAKTFLDKDFKLEDGNDKPQILIYHTHGSETFADYGAEHPEGNVIGLGSYLTKLLEEKGYRVIHDTSVYDMRGGKLDRNKAYSYALEGITEILQKNPSVQVVLDLHRDGVSESLHMVSEVNGKPTAPIMFFNGMSQTPTGPIEYLQNPYREDNLAFSLQMQLDAEAYYPGLTRRIYLKGLRYNLHLRPRSALIEVGAQTNTTQEAMNTMEPLSELLDMILQGK